MDFGAGGKAVVATCVARRNAGSVDAGMSIQDFLNTGGRICNRERTQKTQRIDQVPCGTGFVFVAFFRG